MRFSSLLRTLLPAMAALGALCVGSSMAPDQSGAQTKSQACPSNDSGLKLPAGFCATIFADNIGHARQLVVAPSGVVYVNTWSGDYYPPGDKPPAGGFLVALQDKTGTGKADVNERFGETVARMAAEPAARASPSTRARFTRRSTIESCAMRCLRGRSCPRVLPLLSFPDCPLGAITPCTRSSSPPTGQCMWMWVQRPTPAS